MPVMAKYERPRPVCCKRCGRPASTRVPISRRALCPVCSIHAQSTSWAEMAGELKGEPSKWETAMARRTRELLAKGVVDPRTEGVARMLRAKGHDL